MDKQNGILHGLERKETLTHTTIHASLEGIMLTELTPPHTQRLYDSTYFMYSEHSKIVRQKAEG